MFCLQILLVETDYDNKTKRVFNFVCSSNRSFKLTDKVHALKQTKNPVQLLKHIVYGQWAHYYDLNNVLDCYLESSGYAM